MINTNNCLTKLSTFSGICGDDLASELVGINTVAFCEQDIFCQRIIRKYWGNDILLFEDIKDVTKKKFQELTKRESVDIIAGGFPCQPFSNAGKRQGKADDRYLWEELLRVIHEFQPTWFIGENVTGIVNMVFHTLLSNLESEGYEAQTFLIPACGVNAPHKRERFFVIAYSDQYRLQRSQQRRKETNTRYFTPIRWNTKWDEIQRDNLPTPFFCRSHDGIPNWVDRIKALGNSNPPQLYYPIYKHIKELMDIIEPNKEITNS